MWFFHLCVVVDTQIFLQKLATPSSFPHLWKMLWKSHFQPKFSAFYFLLYLKWGNDLQKRKKKTIKGFIYCLPSWPELSPNSHLCWLWELLNSLLREHLFPSQHLTKPAILQIFVLITSLWVGKKINTKLSAKYDRCLEYILCRKFQKKNENSLCVVYSFIYFLLYNIVLVLPYINMNLPWEYTGSPSWTPLLLPSPYHPSGSSHCTTPRILYHASNLDWRFVSYMILYKFQCHFPKS